MTADTIKKWQIGNLEVYRIVEVSSLKDPLAVLLKNGNPEMLKSREWLYPYFASPEGDMYISFQAFAIKAGDRRIMIDTCIGCGRDREFAVLSNLQTSFLEDLELIGFSPDKVDTVLCTHLHYDHVGWNTRLVDGKWVPTFPNARYLIGRAEWEHWQDLWRTGKVHHEAHLNDSVMPVINAGLVDFVETDYQISDEIRLLPTPGHTPGHVSVLLDSAGEQAVITGDALHHPVQFALPDEVTNFCMDPEQACRTRRALIERFEDRKALVIGSHFPDPTAGWIDRDETNWRFTVKE